LEKIEDELLSKGINVYIYDLEPQIGCRYLETEPKQVIIMAKTYTTSNDDIKIKRKLSTGQMVVQGSHASHKIADYVKQNKPDLYEQWMDTGYNKVCVQIDSDDFDDISEQLSKTDLNYCVIRDSEVIDHDGNEFITAIAIGPDLPDKINKITGRMKLL
jgi:peptidyl-tRNA hydrolase